LLIPEVAEALNLDPERQQAIKEVLDAMEAREEQLEHEVRQKDLQEIAHFPGRNWDEVAVHGLEHFVQ
jgi:hypothetical protein